MKKNKMVFVFAAICIFINYCCPVCSHSEDSGISLARSAYNPYPIINKSMSNHCMIEMNDRVERNRIVLFGDNRYGQCGKPNTESYLKEPNVLKLKYDDGSVADPKQLLSGGRHSIAMTPGGDIWTWGDNTYGQLGRETEGSYDYEPKLVDFSDYPDIVSFTAIAAGEYHNLAVDQDGNLYAWGRNNYYQLGRDDIEYSVKPIKIAENIKYITTKFNHNLVSDKDDHLFVFGNNDCGQLGNPEITDNKCAELIEVAYPEGYDRVWGSQVAVGEHHSVGRFYSSLDRTYQSEVYVWGDNSKYQLGIDNTVIQESSVPIKLLGDCDSIVCGRNYTIVNKKYWFGTGCAISQEYPEDVLKTPTERNISCIPGYDGGMIDGSNAIRVWGKNDKGQLMQKPDSEWHYLKTINFLNIEPKNDIPINLFDGSKLKMTLYFLNWSESPRDFNGNSFEMPQLFHLVDFDTDKVIGRFSDVELIDDTHAIGTVKLNEDFVPEKDTYNIVVSGGYPAVTTLSGFYNIISTAQYNSEPKKLMILCDNPPRSGRTDGQTITAEITGGTFKETLDVDNWQVLGIDGVDVGKVTRIDDTHAEITLRGNNSDRYVDKTISLVCDGREYTGSITKSEDGTLEYQPLTSENSIELQKQRRSSGGSQKTSATPSPTPTINPTLAPTVIPQKQWEMVMTIGSNNILINGEKIQNDVAPKIVNDRAMLPSRCVAENLGATVEWDNDKQLVTINGKDTTILITIGAKKAIVNGNEVMLETPAFIENDRTYTPLRLISEQLGAKVEWDSGNVQITITKN